MALLNSNSNEVTITGVKASTVALFEGTFAAAIGLFVAIVFSLRATINLSQETNSVLAGMSLGLLTGAVGIIVLPFVYFAIGWLVGYLHGMVFNAVVNASGGIAIYTAGSKK